MLGQKGMIPGTTYIRTWYLYQYFLFNFPFDEILRVYRRLLFFTLTRYVCTTRAVVLLIVQPHRYLFIRQWVVVRMTPTFRPRTHTSDDSYIYQLSLVVATATVSFFIFRLMGYTDICFFQPRAFRFRVIRLFHN